MKQIILGACCLLVIVYAVYANENFAASAFRETEVNMALSHSVEQTLEEHRRHAFSSEEEMERYMIKTLKSQITSGGVLKISIISSDCTYGMLDVAVTQYYETSDQKKREVTARKCGIIDQRSNT